MKRILIIIFIGFAFLQWIVPLKMIYDNQKIINKGRTVKFKTAPLDPSNPFIGKYVLLKFDEETIKTNSNKLLSRGEEIFVSLSEDNRGFVHPIGLSKVAPQNGKLYVKANVYYSQFEGNQQSVMLDYPFNKFYMDEYKVPKAERVYQESNSNMQKQDVYALVNLLDGDGIIRDIIINDTSITELVKRNRFGGNHAVESGP
jgi:uncharacterized membrane-anchored protein